MKASTEDSLLGETLNTYNTIRACTTFFKRPGPGIGRVEEVRRLFGLGDGINGFAHVCHGGLVAVMLDETLGSLMWKNKANSVQTAMTAELKISYLAPIKTPQVVLVTGQMGEVKGRKYYIDGTVKDCCGTTLAKAEALWIAVSTAKEKL